MSVLLSLPTFIPTVIFSHSGRYFSILSIMTTGLKKPLWEKNIYMDSVELMITALRLILDL